MRFNPDHNYRSAATYRIAIMTVDGTPPLAVNHVPTPLGELAICEVISLMKHLPQVEILRVIVDAGDLIVTLHVTRNIPDHLRDIIALLDENTVKAVRESLLPNEFKAPILKAKHVYQKEFRDRILTSAEEYERFRTYDEQCAYRARIVEEQPQLLTTPQILDIDGKPYMCLGNFLLLRHPDRRQVRISRSFIPEKVDGLFRRWRETIRSGGVVVSPFVSAKEKEIYTEAVETGGRIIRIVNSAPAIRAGHNHLNPHISPEEKRLLEEHRLLLIAEVDLPKELRSQTPYSRENCMRMNEVALLLCEDHDSMRVLAPGDRTFC